MADTKRKLIIEIDVEGTATIKQDLKDIEEQGTRTAKSAELAGLNLKAGYLAASQAIRDVIAVGQKFLTITNDLTDASNRQIKVEVDLAAALRAHGNFTEEAFRAQVDYANQLQATTAINSDAILQTAALVEGITGLGAEALPLATQAVIQLSKQYDINTEASAKLLAKAIDTGRQSVRTGIQIDKTKDIMGELNKVIDQTAAGMVIAEAEANTYEGAILQLENQWGGLKAVLGDFVTKNPFLIESIQAVATEVGVLTGHLTDFVDDEDKVTSAQLAVASGFLSMAIGVATAAGEIERLVVTVENNKDFMAVVFGDPDASNLGKIPTRGGISFLDQGTGRASVEGFFQEVFGVQIRPGIEGVQGAIGFEGINESRLVFPGIIESLVARQAGLEGLQFAGDVPGGGGGGGGIDPVTGRVRAGTPPPGFPVGAGFRRGFRPFEDDPFGVSPIGQTFGLTRGFRGGLGGGGLSQEQTLELFTQSVIGGPSFAGFGGLSAGAIGGGFAAMAPGLTNLQRIRGQFGGGEFAQLAGVAAGGGGLGGVLGAAGGIAGGAFGPLGALAGGFLGGGLGRTLGGIFGGGGKPRGDVPSRPVFTEDQGLREQMAEFLNVTQAARARVSGAGIDTLTRQLNRAGAA